MKTLNRTLGVCLVIGSLCMIYGALNWKSLRPTMLTEQEETLVAHLELRG